MTSSTETVAQREPTAKEIRLVIAASSAGTVFEWYDFFIYGTLATFISQAFFPADNATFSLLLTWAGFAIGFGFRPLGAVLFGYLGDKLGRKYTFLVTVTLMGIATAGVGFVPSVESIGYAAPILVILLRVAQGLALGGEYGGAAIYVAEHAPPGRRGFYTSFIQASVVGGFILSLLVVLACRFLFPADVFAAWGWRVPFIISIILLAVSLWMRLKLNESPVFQAMKEAGEMSHNPFVESFTYPGNKKRIFVALFGVACGLTIVFYTAFFSTLSFLKGPMRVDDTAAELIVGLGSLFAVGFMIYFGRLSDRIGRKKPIVWGYVASLLLIFPLFWGLGAVANPQLAAATRDAPILVTGPECTYDPLADGQVGACGQVLGFLTDLGFSYTVADGPDLVLTVGGDTMPFGTDAGSDVNREALTALLEANGYSAAKQVPPAGNILAILALLAVFGVLAGATYGPVAAVLTEMFPTKVRYSSMSIPYHFGAGYFGGFLPLIAGYIVARTGDIYAGQWYGFVMLVLALVIGWWGLKDGPPTDFADDDA
jgi:MFS family permease